ncbi:anti-sigma factor family protein [Thermodesulfobacteriota bacterium]
MMRCGRVRKNLIDFIEDRLRGRARAGIEAHLEGCPICRKELGLLRSTLGDLRGIEVEDPGEPFWETLREETFRRYRETRNPEPTETLPFLERIGIRPLPAAAWATAGAACCVVAALVVHTILQRPTVPMEELGVIIEAAQETDDLDTFIDALPGNDIEALASLTIDVEAPEGTVGDLLAEDYDISRSNQSELALLDILKTEELATLFEILEERYPAPQDKGPGKRSSQAVTSRNA